MEDTKALLHDERDGVKAHQKVLHRRRREGEVRGSFGRDCVGLGTMLVGVVILLALASYEPSDPSFFTETSQHRAENLLGTVGAQIAAFGVQFFGFGSYAFPLLVFFFGVQVLRRRGVTEWFFVMLGGVTIWVCALTLLGGMQPIQFKDAPLFPGGSFGIELWVVLTRYFNPLGTCLIVVFLAMLAFLMATQLTLRELVQVIVRIWTRGVGMMQGLWMRLAAAVESRKKRRVAESIISRELEKMAGADHEPKRVPGRREGRSIRATDEIQEPEPASVMAQEPDPLDAIGEPQVPPEDGIPIHLQKRQERVPKQESLSFMSEEQAWVLPKPSFFEAPSESNQIDREELQRKAKQLETKFQEFSITGQMKAIHPGPVVTTYEFKPDAGIKYSRIVNLQDDLCLALAAESIRIDRMPGRSSIGLEVPNTKREIISFRQMLESERFQKERSKLLIALGKSIEGDPFYSDLSKMPHLLIAGQTGSGKSVGVNGMICSILMRCSPEDVKFVLIDPKMVEMGIYADIPHLLTPVVVDPHEAANALKWAVAEMEVRYKKLAQYQYRSLEDLNQAIAQGRIKGDDIPERSPLIVIVIDELADLMMVARGEVEESIARIAQKSRAVGIHLILATQRPSVDIITGVIKSNLPSRLSYRVAQKNDSRIILDANGAEKLLGRGDCLFLPPGTARLIRLHAPFLREREISQVVGFLKKQRRPSYDERVVRQLEGADESSEGHGGGLTGDDPMYSKAARLVVSSGQASVSFIQRKLSLGYARSAKLMDMMEKDGIVGPHVGSKAREILVPADYFDQVDQSLR